MSLSLLSYVLRAAIKDKIYLALLIAMILVYSLSSFFSGAATIEKDQFDLVYTAGSLRLISLVGLVLFVVFFVRRSDESKDIEFLLARPLGRVQMIVSYGAAFSVLAFVVGALQGAFVLLSAGSLALHAGHILWCASVIAEAIVVVNFAFFVSMVISSQSAATLAALAFYVLGRLSGHMLGIIESHKGDVGIDALEWLMQVISVIVPRFDLFGQTSWLIYGPPDSAFLNMLAFMQAFVFVVILMSAASLDMLKREF